MKIVWVSSWDRVCGIADYSKILFPATEKAAQSQAELRLLSLDRFTTPRALVNELVRLRPELIHFQHEYGLFGGKNPPRYWFPRVIARLRAVDTSARIVATAHTVLAPDYRFPLTGRGLGRPVRWAANRWLLPRLRAEWGPRTWGALDGVIVHSRLQKPAIEAAGAPLVEEIPHFVPVVREPWKAPSATPRKILVFGFLTPEKGQDIAIEALARIPGDARLILAGGVRRSEDRAYYARLQAEIGRLGLSERVEITGFVPAEKIGAHYAEADLVLAPFRETSGSGSLAQALARGAPVLASDLALNGEIAERVPGAIAFFRSASAEDCARACTELLADRGKRLELAAGATRYAEAHGPEKIAAAHLRFYERVLLGSGKG